MVVVSFHSLEDSRVKNYLRGQSGEAPQGSRHVPQAKAAAKIFDLISRKAIAPSDEETRSNSRARSAKLRAAIRTEEGA